MGNTVTLVGFCEAKPNMVIASPYTSTIEDAEGGGDAGTPYTGKYDQSVHDKIVRDANTVTYRHPYGSATLRQPTALRPLRRLVTGNQVVYDDEDFHGRPSSDSSSQSYDNDKESKRNKNQRIWCFQCTYIRNIIHRIRERLVSIDSQSKLVRYPLYGAYVILAYAYFGHVEGILGHCGWFMGLVLLVYTHYALQKHAWNEAWETFVFNYQFKYEEKVLPFCNKYGKFIQAFFILASITLIYALYHVIRTADESITLQRFDRIYAQDGDPGVNFSAPSSEFTCRELRSGAVSSGDTFATMIRRAHKAMDIDERLLCTCAPMFGIRRQHMTLRVRDEDASGGESHHSHPQQLVEVFNAYADVGYAKEHSVGRRYMREKQRKLFPERSELYKVLRNDTIKLIFQNKDTSCSRSSIILHKDEAYCVQACLDLMQGITIYDKGMLISNL